MLGVTRGKNDVTDTALHDTAADSRLGTAVTVPPDVDATIGDAPASVSARAIGRGSQIGRFVVMDALGRGGMGLVVAAYDPDLDRRVAVKLLLPAHASGTATDPGEARDRLLREARAMARLSHPNVLAVHEVGTVDDQIFIATEFAAGGTLQSWVTDAKRSWRDVLDRYVEAGRGLEAAHEAGLVHRDFKPENVLLHKDGRVCVADFGLAGLRQSSPERHAEPASRDSAPASARLEQTISAEGAIFGTPLYMSPEQHRGERVGPLSDQFSFAVALWEGLFGQRPFAGTTYRELAASASSGTIVEPSDVHDVPERIVQILRRALRVDAAQRWPSMTEMLAALEHDPAQTAKPRRAWIVAIGAVACVLAVGGIAIKLSLRPDGPELCTGADEKLRGVWDESRKVAVQRAFVATRQPYAEDAFRGAKDALDTYAQTWIATRTEACKATRVKGEQSEA